ncbi:diacylglycerol acyltransferase-domain-containing protein [Pavlovales sp. CCMP2436]|nr:diacylglycerol acyltransferase-domain-containing protein [Pavlovales sp. CCMP2436]
MTVSALFFGGLLSLRRQPVEWYTGVASILFNCPGLREVLLLLNAREISRGVMDSLLAAGHSVGVQPGGIYEQLHSDHRREQAFFPPNLTFIRLAMAHGTPLLPLYLFGENQLYATSPLLQALARFVYGLTGIPALIPLGRWGLPTIVPKPRHVAIRFGRPVHVGPPQKEPSDAAVEEVYIRYTAELNRLWNEHKAALPPEVAAQGLNIVRRTRPVQPPQAKLGRAAATNGCADAARH